METLQVAGPDDIIKTQSRSQTMQIVLLEIINYQVLYQHQDGANERCE